MERSLAHIEKVAWVKPIANADNIELIGINGWQCISKIGEMKLGEKVVYIEIDSLVDKDDERFAFLEPKHYKIKTMKLGAKLGGVFSQGLAMPLSLFPELGDPEIGTDVTNQLKITYSNPNDVARKSNKPDKKTRINSMMARLHKTHPKLVKTSIFKFLARRDWGIKILFILFSRKMDNIETKFPTKFEFIHKTDEIRCENINQEELFSDKEPWIQTVKLDGTSSTYLLERKKHNKFEYYVCSRNVRQMNENQETYHERNVYWDMEHKYNIRAFLETYLKNNPDVSYVALQGETVGVGVQNNPHKLKDTQFFGFNFIDSIRGRWNSVEAAKLCAENGINWVPIVSTAYVLPDDMETLKTQADGNLADYLPGASGLREGFVYRSYDGQRSFKNVSRQYLLKHEG